MEMDGPCRNLPGEKGDALHKTVPEKILAGNCGSMTRLVTPVRLKPPSNFFQVFPESRVLYTDSSVAIYIMLGFVG